MINNYETFVQFKPSTGELTIKLTGKARGHFMGESTPVPQHIQRQLGEANGNWRQTELSSLSWLMDHLND